MKIRPIVFPGTLLALAALILMSASVLAAPHGQVQQYATPTPRPDGRIIYIVQAGDTCTRISLLTGVSEEYLRQTNRLDENCTIIENQELVIGVGGPAGGETPTVGPGPTLTESQPTPLPEEPGLTEVCVLLYADVNGDGLRQEAEFGVPGGAVSVTSANGTYSQSQQTVAQLDPDTVEPVRTCFGNVPAGRYTVSAAVPDGYNPTTGLSYDIEVASGATAYVAFGAQVRAQDAGVGGTGGSPLLGILGVVILLVGVGLGVYAWRTYKR
ncbi:MAG: LysM peptidoglycan-binding domain-containing protein [Anaerolineales bacterium]|nr:LysM peptidoglycan-binding domain-containing protein [Anaerolineales bacterium]